MVYDNGFDGPEEFIEKSPGNLAPATMHDFINYSYCSPDHFHRMQEELKKELARDTQAIKAVCKQEGFDFPGGYDDILLNTCTTRPMDFRLVYRYDAEKDSLNIGFDIFDSEVFEEDGTHYLPDDTVNLCYHDDVMRQCHLLTPAARIATMEYEDFQAWAENGIQNLFKYCLKDEKFRSRHPVVREAVENWLGKEHFLPNSESPELKDVHSFFDYRKWAPFFQEMQDSLRKELEDESVCNAIKSADGWTTTNSIQGGLPGPYIDTNSNRFISFDPYLKYDEDFNQIYIVFDIPDHEVETDIDGRGYPLEYLNEKFWEPEFQLYAQNDFGLAIPADQFVSMSLEEFQKTFEKGAMNLFKECLENDPQFQERHSVIQQLVEKEKVQAKEEASKADGILDSIKPFSKDEVEKKREFINAYYGGCLHDALESAEKNGQISDEDIAAFGNYCYDEHGNLNVDHENKIVKAFGISKDDVVRLLDDELRHEYPWTLPKADSVAKVAAGDVSKDEPSIRLQDLMDPKTRSETVRMMTDFFVQHGMDLNQVDDLFSEMKMTAIFHAEEAMRDAPLRDAPTQSGGR